MLTTAVGLTLSGHIYTRYVEGGMRSRDVIAFLKHLLRYMPKGFVLICDHASIHTSAETLRFLFEHPEILVEPLPKYAPELNPEDGFAVSWECESPPRERHARQRRRDAPDAGSRALPVASQTRSASGLHSCCRLICKPTLVKLSSCLTMSCGMSCREIHPRKDK